MELPNQAFDKSRAVPLAGHTAKNATSPSMKKWFYILHLEGDYWYVGTTNNLENRLLAHQSGKGSAWTKEHPMLTMVESGPLTSPLLEDFKTKELMQKYGIAKVRGGSYCQVKLSTEQWQTLNREFRAADQRCLNCGGVGHFVANCPKQSAKQSKPTYPKKPRKPRVCSRCGRNSHDIRTCYANTHFDGTSLDGVPYYKKTLDQENTEELDLDEAAPNFRLSRTDEPVREKDSDSSDITPSQSKISRPEIRTETEKELKLREQISAAAKAEINQRRKGPTETAEKGGLCSIS